MELYQRIRKDHDRQRALAAEIMKTEGNSSDRRGLWNDFKNELEAHARAEEQVYYAELLERPQGTDKARHSIAEHKQMNDTIEELDEMDMSSPGWLLEFRTLKDVVEHHLEEEEREVFPLSGRLFADTKEEMLAQRFDTRKQEELRA